MPGCITAYLYSSTFGRNTSAQDAIGLRYEDIDAAAYPRAEFTFPCQDDTLQGYRFDIEDPCGLAVFVHGLNSDANTLLPLEMYFHDHGWEVISFDGTATGKSTGERLKGLCQQKYCLEAALDYIAADLELSTLPVVCIGHSMGAYAVTASLAEGYTPRAAVAISTVNSADETMNGLVSTYLGPVDWLFAPHIWMQNRIAFGNDANLTAIQGINATETPVLCVYGTQDEAVPPSVSGIPKHKAEITNPNFKLIEISEEYRNRHSAPWLTADSAHYAYDIWDERDALWKKHGKPLPADVHQELLASIDKTHVGMLDQDFAGQLESFCRAAIN